MTEKLQKILAGAGLGSRREIENWIREGRISVNGKIAVLGQRITAEDRVRVDGHEVRLTSRHPQKCRVLLYHKPEGEICSRKDPEGRPSVYDHLPLLRNGRWVSIGRLDFNTSGILLFTNDGEMAHRLMHPASGIEREYAVRTQGELSSEQIKSLKQGIDLADGPARFLALSDQGGEGSNHWYHVTVEQGRNRIVRRLFEALDIRVSRLIRIRFGGLLLPRMLRRGKWVELTPEEVSSLTQPQEKSFKRVESDRPARNRAPGTRSVRKEFKPASSRPHTGRPASRSHTGRPDSKTRRPAAGPRDRDALQRSSGPRNPAAGRRRGEETARPASRGRSSDRREKDTGYQASGQGRKPPFGKRTDRPAPSGRRGDESARPASRGRSNDRREKDTGYQAGGQSRKPSFGKRTDRPAPLGRRGDESARPASRGRAGDRREKSTGYQAGGQGRKPSFGKRTDRPASLGRGRTREEGTFDKKPSNQRITRWVKYPETATGGAKRNSPAKSERRTSSGKPFGPSKRQTHTSRSVPAKPFQDGQVLKLRSPRAKSKNKS